MSTGRDIFEQALERHAAGQIVEAARLYEQVVRANPRHAHAWHQLACIASAQAQTDVAMDYFVRAIRLDGGQALFHSNFGECCRLAGKLPEAESSFRQAIRLAADDVAPRVNLSLTLYALGRADEAEQTAREALRMDRRTVEEHCQCATLALLRGDFENGLAEHEQRLHRPGVVRPDLPGAAWNGEPLEGRSILLYAEQGLGDTLQFARYVPHVERRGGQVHLAAPKNLHPLLREADLCPVVGLESPGDSPDFHAALMSLPFLCGTTLTTIPNEVPYLRANDDLSRQWRGRLADVDGFRVGIGWQGNPAYAADRTRSIRLEHFQALADVPGISLVSLQKGPGVDQLDEVADRFEVHRLPADFDTDRGAFMDTAAVMQQLDLIVTSDSAIAHLAGALGVPVWVALPIVPDWRWLLTGESCPWYPAMRLFRQSRASDWSEVFGRIADSLRDAVVAK